VMRFTSKRNEPTATKALLDEMAKSVSEKA